VFPLPREISEARGENLPDRGGLECLFLAITRRQSLVRCTSGVASASDLPAAMSGFGLIPSGYPPGPDVADYPSVRGKVTLSGPIDLEN
jgi:hypothetical protein